MKKEQKEQIVSELARRLKAADTVLVADYRGLTMPQIDTLRSRLLESGARFTVVKNTLTRRAAEEAGASALLTLLEGPTAIAFLEADGDMLAAAKALSDMARESKIMAIRGGVLEGRILTAEEVESLATLPPVDILRGQVLGAIVAPLTSLLGLVTAPVQNLYGLIEARIEQLGGEEAAPVLPSRSLRKSKATPAVAARSQRLRKNEATDTAVATEEEPTVTEDRTGELVMAGVDTIFESLGKMSVLELVELKKKIEDEWGITAAAPVAVAAAGGGAAAPAEEEKTAFDVVLTEAGGQKIQVIKVVRAITGSRPEGSEGPRRLGSQAGQGGRRPGRGEHDQGPARGSGSDRRDQVGRRARFPALPASHWA